jgi:hypothetical protein
MPGTGVTLGSMVRTLLVAASLGATTLLPGCSMNPDRHHIIFEVDGDAGAAREIRYELPNTSAEAGWRTAADAPVPWSQVDSTDPGLVTLEATPTSGTLTCRVLVDGREVARATGQPGAPVRCNPSVSAD